jgi:hypothetical protein
VSEVVYRFSGHESFPCRYAWIPKAVEAISGNPEVFGDVEEALVKLGLGKNMVQSLRFYASPNLQDPVSELRSSARGFSVREGSTPIWRTFQRSGYFTGNCVRTTIALFSHGIFYSTDFTSLISFGPMF